MHPRLKNRSDFLKVADKGGFCPSRSVIVQYLAIGDQIREDNSLMQAPVCVGFTASKRVGNAVQRNRAKRRLREAFEVVSKNLDLKDCYVVLIAKTATVTVPYEQLLEDLSYALGRCKVGKFATPRPRVDRSRGKKV